MEIKRLNSECIKCLTDKYIKNIPDSIDEDKKLKFMQRVLDILASADYGLSAPELTEQITLAQREVLELETDYSEIKSYFNKLLLSKESEIEEKINQSPDSFKTALLYALSGNFIDFGAMQSVDEAQLLKTLADAEDIKVSETEIENLRADIKKAQRLVYLTDNCGEIVLDKLFIKTIRQQNQELEINVIVRGDAVLNDCTIEDAVETDMYSVADVVPNGTAVAGTSLDKISLEAKELIDTADLIIAKGQGNFETLRFCGKNIYYLFLCKCSMFANRFNVERFSGMLLNDKRM